MCIANGAFLICTSMDDCVMCTAGGEWVTAYQAEQRSKLKTVFLSQHQSLHNRGSGRLSPPTNTREASGLPKKTLDKEFLMRHCFVEQPTDLSDGDISGMHLTTVSNGAV